MNFNNRSLLSIRIPLIALGIAIFIPAAAAAGWNILIRNDQDAETNIKIASSRNSDGYGLEIYRDPANAIRSRFILAGGLLQFAENICPTYQIDRGTPNNLSIDDTPCQLDQTSAEYILGYVENGNIASSNLLALMNGIAISYRFRLVNGDYRETKFSLQGSKRAMTDAFGEDIHVILKPQ